MFEKFRKKLKKEEATIENKYEIYGKRFEEIGLFKPIYKSKAVTICNVCNYCYYIIYNESGIAINISPDKIIDLIEDPLCLLALFSKLPYEEQRKHSFMLGEYRLEKVLSDVKNKVEKDPSISCIDTELEQQIIEKFGTVV